MQYVTKALGSFLDPDQIKELGNTPLGIQVMTYLRLSEDKKESDGLEDQVADVERAKFSKYFLD